MSINEKNVYEVVGVPDKIYPKSTVFGWKDITGDVLVRGVAATDPDWAQIGTSVFYAYKFAVGDYVWFVFHVPHDIVPGADVHFHAHWTSDGTNTEVVKWEWIFMYAKGFNQANFDVGGTTITAEEAAAGSAYRHMVTESAAVSISGLTEPDGIIVARVRRVTNGGTDNTDGIFLLTSDIHHQTTDQSTIGKAPNFYQA